MRKRATHLLNKSIVLTNKSARLTLDATYAVEELCGLFEPLAEENDALSKRCSKLEKEIDRWKELMKNEVARLKAENKRLRSGSFVTAVPSEQYERLRKAGDEVLREWSMGDEKGAKNYLKALVIWNAAKEGKPSE